MPRILPVGAFIFVYFGTSYGLSGQTPDRRTPDTRLDDAVKEIALLKRALAEQDRRIAGLERAVKSQQAAVLASARRVPTVPWRDPEAWAAIKIGMSRAQVVEILGEPKSTDSVMDRQTLWYRDATDPVGNVVITDDRVSEVASPRFLIYLPLAK